MRKEKSLMRQFIEWSISQKKAASMTCELCSTRFSWTRELVCHHIIPVKKSGVNAPLLMDRRNILVLCHDCHNLIEGTFGTMAAYSSQKFHWGGSLSMIYNFGALQSELSRITHQYGLT